MKKILVDFQNDIITQFKLRLIVQNKLQSNWDAVHIRTFQPLCFMFYLESLIFKLNLSARKINISANLPKLIYIFLIVILLL